MWEVYIIQTETGQLYTGITNDLKKRLEAHSKERKGGARFFRISGPKEVLFRESHPNRSEASKRESMIKKMSRAEKLEMITAIGPPSRSEWDSTRSNLDQLQKT